MIEDYNDFKDFLQRYELDIPLVSGESLSKMYNTHFADKISKATFYNYTRRFKDTKVNNELLYKVFDNVNNKCVVAKSLCQLLIADTDSKVQLKGFEMIKDELQGIIEELNQYKLSETVYIDNDDCNFYID